MFAMNLSWWFVLVHLVIGMSCIAGSVGVLPHPVILMIEGLGSMILALLYYLHQGR
jgi:hypothetical protein